MVVFEETWENFQRRRRSQYRVVESSLRVAEVKRTGIEEAE